VAAAAHKIVGAGENETMRKEKKGKERKGKERKGKGRKGKEREGKVYMTEHRNSIQQRPSQ
jgi:hypothetical protein